MIRVFSGPLTLPPEGTVVFDTGPITTGGDVDLGSLSVSVDGPANLRLEIRDSTNTTNLLSFVFVIANDVKVFDVNTYTFPLQPNERIRLVITSTGVRFIQASMTYRIFKRFAATSGGVGTSVVAAAVPGSKHKVFAYHLSMAANGTYQFTDNVGDLSGAITQQSNPGPGIAIASDYPLLVTAVNSALNIVTTGGGVRGYIVFTTEP